MASLEELKTTRLHKLDLIKKSGMDPYPAKVPGTFCLEDARKSFVEFEKKGKEVFEISPAPNCPSGVKGRVAVMEVLKIDKEMEQIILKNPTEQEIWKYARSKGMFTMKDDALIKVFNKVIPFEEYNSL